MIKNIRQYQKFVIPLALALIVGLAGMAKNHWSAKPAEPQANQVSPETEGTETKPTGIERGGIVEPAVLFHVHSSWNGRLIELYVQEGQAVKAGQPLCKLEAIPVAAPPAAKVRTNSGAMPVNPLTYERALKQYEQLKKLYAQGAISRRELESAEARLQALQSQSGDSPDGSSESSTAGPVTLTASVDGIVIGLAVLPGAAIQAEQRILSLGSGQKIEVVVPLEQQELYRVQLGTPVEVKTADRLTTGEVYSIFPEVKENAITAFQAHIRLADPPVDWLQAGMPVQVRIDCGP